MTNRINKIINYIPSCTTLYDIGCDHGILGCECLKSGLAEYVVFTDVSVDCLNKTNTLINSLNLESKSVVLNTSSLPQANKCCKNDLEVIPKADVIVIAGLGAQSIIDLMDNYPTNAIFVLQPMSNVPKLRKFLAKGYLILQDDVFYVNSKYFSIIVVKKSNFISQINYYIPQNVIKNALNYKDYLFTRKQELVKTLNGMKNNSQIFNELSNELNEIKKLI